MTSMVAFAVLLAMALVFAAGRAKCAATAWRRAGRCGCGHARACAGNLRAAIDNKGGADSLLGTLATTLAQLRSMMTEVGRNAEALKASASALAGVARGVAERAQNQSDATSAIAAGVEEMTVWHQSHFRQRARHRHHSLCCGGSCREGRGEDRRGCR